METRHISIVLVAIIVPLVLGWLLRGSSSGTQKQSGISWLVYGKRMKGFALLFSGLVAALVVLWFIVEPKDKMPVLGMIAMFGGLTLPLFLEFFFVRIGYDSKEIYCHSIWRPNREIDWTEVESATFSESLQWWVISTKNSGKIRVHVYISGLTELLRELQNRGVKGA